MLPETARRLREKLTAGGGDHFTREPGAVCQRWQQGSHLEIIARLHQENPLFSGACLSRNRGHQDLMTAGIGVTSPSPWTLTSRTTSKPSTASLKSIRRGAKWSMVSGPAGPPTLYSSAPPPRLVKLMRLMGTPVIDNHADFRLMSRPALMPSPSWEVNLFLRGIVPMVGFKSGIVEYERHERVPVRANIPWGRCSPLPLTVSPPFPPCPIRLITLAGFGIFVVSLLALLIFLVQKLLGYTVQGWATLMGSVAHRRPAAAGTGHSGRVHRQNLHGSQAPAPVCDRTGAGRFSGRRRNTAGRPERLEITTAGTVRRDMIA